MIEDDERCSWCGAIMTKKAHELTPNEGYYLECTNPRHKRPESGE